jgi:hypothetical protein
MTYLECLKEVEEQSEKIIKENKRLMPKDDSSRTIKNIFKMSRVHIDYDKAVKENMMKGLVLHPD